MIPSLLVSTEKEYKKGTYREIKTSKMKDTISTADLVFESG